MGTQGIVSRRHCQQEDAGVPSWPHPQTFGSATKYKQFLAKELTLALPAKQMPRRGRKGNRKSGSGWQKGAAWAGQLLSGLPRGSRAQSWFLFLQETEQALPCSLSCPSSFPPFFTGRKQGRVLLNRGTSFQSSGPRPGEDSGPGLSRTGPIFLIVLLSEFPLGVRGSLFCHSLSYFLPNPQANPALPEYSNHGPSTFPWLLSSPPVSSLKSEWTPSGVFKVGYGQCATERTGGKP